MFMDLIVLKVSPNIGVMDMIREFLAQMVFFQKLMIMSN
jgi:hypothetical protein